MASLDRVVVAPAAGRQQSAAEHQRDGAVGVRHCRRGAWRLGSRAPLARDAWLLGLLSAALLYRASTAHCPVYAAAGISTAETDTQAAPSRDPAA